MNLLFAFVAGMAASRTIDAFNRKHGPDLLLFGVIAFFTGLMAVARSL